MNWIGGERSRTKGKARTRSQREFFKKQRLKNALQKLLPKWPDLSESTDLLKMDMISERLSSSRGIQHAPEAQHTSTIPTRPPVEGYPNSSLSQSQHVTNDGCEDPYPTHHQTPNEDSPRSTAHSPIDPDWLEASYSEGQRSDHESDELSHPPDFAPQGFLMRPIETPRPAIRNAQGASATNVGRPQQPVFEANEEPLPSPFPVPRTNHELRQAPTKPSHLGAQQSTEGTWIEELCRRHQAALMEEIKEQILFKPVEHFSVTSVFDERSSEGTFRRRTRNMLAKHRTLDEELGDYGELSPFSQLSGSPQLQRRELQSSNQPVRRDSSSTSAEASTSSTPKIKFSKSKFFEDRTPVESFETKHANDSAVLTPRHMIRTMPTPTRHATGSSVASTPSKRVGWVPTSVTLTPQVRPKPTPKTQKSGGAEATQERETARAFNQAALSPRTAATPRRGTAGSADASPLRTPNGHLESVSMSRESQGSESMQTRHTSQVSERNENYKNVTSTPVLNQVQMRQGTASNPCNIPSPMLHLVSSNPIIHPEPPSSLYKTGIPSSPLRPSQGTGLFMTPRKSVNYTPKSVWQTPNACLKPTPQRRCESKTPQGKVNHAYDQNTNLCVTVSTPRKDSSSTLLSNQNVSSTPKLSSIVHSEQKNITSPKKLLEHIIVEPPKHFADSETTAQQVVTPDTHCESNEGSQQGDASGPPNELIITAVEVCCSNCRCGIAKVDKACQVVPDHATVGTTFDGCVSSQ